MLMRRMFAAAFLPLVVGAGQGSLGFGEVRYLPRGWTAPKVVKSGGSTYIVPSRPILKKYEVGTRSEASASVRRDRARSSERAAEPREMRPPPAPTVTINLGGGRRITLEPGQAFEAKGKQYLLMGLTEEHAVFKEVETGRIFNRKLK